MKNSKHLLRLAQLTLGICLGSVIACAPTKFYPAVSPTSVCDPSLVVCEQGEGGTTKIVQNFKVGAGKVDILFVIDNSASMAVIQDKLASKFQGFIQNLDAKETDYQIGITTTDLAAVQAKPLVPFLDSSNNVVTTILTKAQSDPVGLFSKAVRRAETVECEGFIKSSYYSYGFGFQEHPNYVSQYSTKCPSPDTRGTLTALEVIKQNPTEIINDKTTSMFRSDAHLNVILVSNDDSRGGGGRAKEAIDKPEHFLNQIATLDASKSKYLEFNSIVTLDAACGNQQANDFKDLNNITIRNTLGIPVINASPGVEYVALSQSASKDVDGNARPRGLTKSICEGNYAKHFEDIATNITESARLLGLKCNPISAPKVTKANTLETVPFLWQGDKILFQKGSEGVNIRVEYDCDVGAVK